MACSSCIARLTVVQSCASSFPFMTTQVVMSLIKCALICNRPEVLLPLQEEDEGLISIGGGSGGAVAAAAPAPVTAPAPAVDEGSSLLSHDEQQEAFFADPTSNGTPPGML